MNGDPEWLKRLPMAIALQAAIGSNPDLEPDLSTEPILTVQLGTHTGESLLLPLHAQAAKQLFEVLRDLQQRPDFQSPPAPPSRGKLQ